jgi:hypothetical protein
MLEAEATRLCAILLAQAGVSPLLNLGSSTRTFREVEQPHIEAQLFGPLREAGIVTLHSDLKAGDGIDLAGDILDPDFVAALKARGFRSVLLANVLEHVRDRAELIAACEDIVGPGGLVLATVPASHPYHADPIDTGYRPSPAELGSAFARSRIVLAEELVGRTYAQQVAARGSTSWREAARTLLWLLAAPVRPRSARARLDRWRWLHRPFRVSIALVQVGPPAGPPPRCRVRSDSGPARSQT